MSGPLEAIFNDDTQSYPNGIALTGGSNAADLYGDLFMVVWLSWTGDTDQPEDDTLQTSIFRSAR
jgi:hypothetical protein